MAPFRHDIKEQFIEAFMLYMKEEDESSLTEAYELGRRAVSAGLGGVELVNIYHEALLEVNSANSDIVQKKNLTIASNFLSECLAPYELRNRGFKDLIEKQKNHNKKLQEEIERRRSSEEELKRSKDHFQQLIENALDIITILNYDGTIRYESPSVKRIMGYAPDELAGQNVFDYLHTDDLAEIKSKLAGVVETPGNLDSAEFRFRHKDGSWRYLESIAQNTPELREGPGIIVNSRNVTERVMARRKLEESERKLLTAQQIGQVGSWEWIVKENKLNWSDELCRIYGVEPGKHPDSYGEYLKLIHPDDRDKVAAEVEKAFKIKCDFEFEHKIVRPDETDKYLYCRGEVTTDEKENIVKMIGVAQDISQIKEAERQLRNYSGQLRNLTARQEKVREDERIRIAREIHDELGQMLTVLKMDISMLVKQAKKHYGEEHVSGFSNEINKIVQRIDTIIHSVQRITSELRPEVLDDLGLKEAIEWHAHEMESRTGLNISFTSMISSDIKKLNEERKTAIFRIFQETITNIIRHADASNVKILLDEDDQYLIVIVSDNGQGIARKDIERSNSFGIIGMRERSKFLGGDLKIEGKPGQGTVVTLKIPLNGT